jgi:hypothetical protein
VLNKFIQKAFIPVTAIIFLGWSCTKIDTTNIGSDLIPAVDNVNTFADTLSVNATQGVFADTTTSNLFNDFLLGGISNDPLFGTTKADIYVQLKPAFFPFRFGNTGDTLNGFGAGLDSVVLCVAYKGSWGDTNALQNLEVYQINDFNFSDSGQIDISSTQSTINNRRISYKPTIFPTLLGSKLLDIRRLKDTLSIGGSQLSVNKEKVINQIRIKLSTAYANALFTTDSSSTGPFANDSLFRRIFHGLAIKTTGAGNALMYTSLNNVNTRLEVHFRKRNGGKVDTTSTSFRLATIGSKTYKFSATANNVERGRSGYPVLTPATSELYLQTTPGTYANLTIPGISAYNNRIIHRAELIIQQVPHIKFYDTTFDAPDYLYLDLVDTSSTPNWKPIYYDLNPGAFYNPDLNGIGKLPSSIDYGYYGGFRRNKVDIFGETINYYNFNISRHLQRIVTNRTPNYTMRLFAPSIINYPNLIGSVSYPNNLALGRVRVGSGTNSNYRMYLRVIYSKL